MTVTLALSGDAILTRRFAPVKRDDFWTMLAPLWDADLGLTHLEGTLCDLVDHDVVPAAEAGGTWLRGPPAVAADLTWAGIDLVTHASNHAMDFGRGGLVATRRALDDADVASAGTGRNLADARLPTYCEVADARVATVSMTTSFQAGARAGEARRDLRGRFGVNPLRYHYEMGPDRLARLEDLAEAMGHWITPGDDEWLAHPPGLHNSPVRVVPSDEPGVRRVLNERDREGNLRAVAEGARQADLTVAHVHTHEWTTDGDLSDPPGFVRLFAHNCIDAGADVVCCQGSHAPLRGVERYDGAAIFYDPGTFFDMAGTSERLPADFFERYAPDLPPTATPGEALAARGLTDGADGEDDESAYGDAVSNPAGGYFSGDVLGTTVPVCEFDDDLDLDRVELVPGELADDPTVAEGLPVRVRGERAREVVAHVDDLSAPFDTSVRFEDGRGVVES
jgi:poly-gamma-glutamate capsule biosynthesis protein CapA/YwtB (metallophosphatase superfamily)